MVIQSFIQCEYEVSYSDNTEVGTAAITITDVMGGNYDINCKAEFDIVKVIRL